MPWPFTFGTATSPLAASHWDDMFNQVGAGMSLPCSAAGSNAISLTPLTGFPALAAYSELGGYRFRAVATSTGAVTAQYNGLGFLPVYHADGTTQASIGDIQSGQQYIITFSQSLNSGIGGFFFESPSQPLTTSTWSQPGGRLTLVSSTPVMTGSVGPVNGVFYAPYQHAFVPIYNGANVQMYNVTSSLSDTVGTMSLSMGGSASWPTGNAFDLFATLIGGVPTLCSVQWTNLTTRATTLGVFGGFLTNSGSATALRSGPTTFTLPANQGTFLGSFVTTGNGACQFVFGSAASGGGQASFGICNYYNKVSFSTVVKDSGVAYTYTSNVVRPARNSTNNSIQFMQSDSERTNSFSHQASTSLVAATGAFAVTAIGVNSTTVYSSFAAMMNPAAVGALGSTAQSNLFLASTGFGTVYALENGDNTNANTFDANSVDTLSGNIWL